MPVSRSAPRLSTLILLSALAILPINIFLPSLSSMAAEFGVDYGVMGLTLAAYALVSAGLQLILGPLSDRFGRRPVILGALAIFIAASLGCIFAPDVSTFLACRTVQAVIAPTYAVSLAAIRDTTDREKAAGTMAYIAMAFAIAPMLGPTLGGLLDEAWGWRASFWFLAMAASGLLVLCWFDLGETNRTPSPSIAAQYRAYPDILRSARFWAYALCMAFSVGAFYIFLVGAPLAVGAALSPGMLGLFMGSITAGFIAGSFLAGRFSSRFPLTTTLVAGRVLACGALLFGLLLHALGVHHVLALFGPCVLVGLSNGLTQPSANAGALSVRPDLAGSAAGLGAAISVAGAAAMSVLAGAILTEANARYALLAVMLVSAGLALGAGLAARRLDRH